MYLFVKCLVRLGLLIFCRKIIFNNKKLLQEKGPLLLACNHPNSFFDALLLGAFFKRPVHFLARGDAFKNPLLRKLLTALKAIPIYRLKEGKEYLALNDNTFERCLDILKEGGIVLIFSEGLCLNQWQLRPLKKGTARIAINAWKQPEIANGFRVLPVSFNYSSFIRFRKNVLINFGEPVLQNHLDSSKTEAEQILEFNRLLCSRLERQMLIEQNENLVSFLMNTLTTDKSVARLQYLKAIQERFHRNPFATILEKFRGTKKTSLTAVGFFENLILIIVLVVPALISLLIHFPLYLLLNNFVKRKTKGTVFYHSALFGALIIFYPFYLITITTLAVILSKNLLVLSLFFIGPLLAFLHLQWKDSFESVYNFLSLLQKERKHMKSVIEDKTI